MNDQVPELIRAEIAAHGPISLARFMELALYHPEWGYYEQSPRPIGRHGDFFTSVSVGRLFGDLLGFQFSEWLTQIQSPRGNGPLQIVEAGAHDGRLAADILSGLQQRQPGLFSALEYWMVEPSPRRAALQQEMLRAFGPKVRWFAGLQELAAVGVQGVFFCNELLDAMPVHRWGWDASRRQWFEWGVRWQADRFDWIRMAEGSASEEPTPGSADIPVGSNPAPPLPPEELQAVLPDGFTVETAPQAEAWWTQAARSLRPGRLVAFDYGFTAEEFFAPHRAQGTLRAYYQHELRPDALSQPGEQDLTAHVNFTRFQAAGEAAGLRTETFREQGRFLGEVARRWWALEGQDWSTAQVRQFQTLTHPGFLGMSFQVLVQTTV